MSHFEYIYSSDERFKLIKPTSSSSKNHHLKISVWNPPHLHRVKFVYSSNPPCPCQLTESQLRDSLEEAVDQNTKTYARSFALHVRWEDDNGTKTQKDCDNFRDFLAAFGFPPPTAHILELDDWSPTWTLESKIMTTVIPFIEHSPESRSIYFIHYSGRSIVGPNGNLYLTSASGNKRIETKYLFGSFGCNAMLPSEVLVDMVFILDCCYSCLETKYIQPVSRSVDILAAAGANAPGVCVLGERVSFSAKLAAKVAQQRETGHQTINMAELVAILRAESPQQKPTHAVPVGVSSACLLFPGSAPGAHPTGPPALRAVFGLEVNREFSDQELRDLMEWLESLGPNNGLTLEGVYKTSSTAFVFQGSYAVYSQLKGLPSVKLLFDCSTPNRLSLSSP